MMMLLLILSQLRSELRNLLLSDSYVVSTLTQNLNTDADAAHCYSEESIHCGVQGFMGG